VSKHKELPIMLGKKLNKGILAFRNREWNGFDLYIVWLKKEYATGDAFEVDDIKSVNAMLHFCDKNSVDVMTKMLEQIRDIWVDDYDES